MDFDSKNFSNDRELIEYLSTKTNKIISIEQSVLRKKFFEKITKYTPENYKISSILSGGGAKKLKRKRTYKKKKRKPKRKTRKTKK